MLNAKCKCRRLLCANIAKLHFPYAKDIIHNNDKNAFGIIIIISFLLNRNMFKIEASYHADLSKCMKRLLIPNRPHSKRLITEVSYCWREGFGCPSE